MRGSVLITGCSSGFGFALARELLRREFRVFASYRNAESRKELFAEEIAKHSDRFHVLSLDVTDSADRRAALDYVSAKTSGEAFTLVNNAGFGVFGAFEDASEEDLRRQYEVNLLGLALLTKEFLPLLRRTNGKLINISSILGLCGAPLTSLYCSSKFAVEGLSESLYHELRPYGVQVCIVEPGAYGTQFGNNVAWNIAEDSPYASKVRRYKSRFIQKFRPSGSESAGKTLADLIERKRLPLRFRMGYDAQLLYCLRSILPERVYNLIFYSAVRGVYYRDE